MKLAILGPVDVQRLFRDCNLRAVLPGQKSLGSENHQRTDIVLALRGLVEHLDVVTFDPNVRSPEEYFGDALRLAVLPIRSRPRVRVRDAYRYERSQIEQQLSAWQPDYITARQTYEYALGSLDYSRDSVVTVHDWSPAVFRHSSTPFRAARVLTQGVCLARGRHFGAVSPYIRSKIQRFTKNPVSLTPNGLASHWFDRTDVERVPGRVLAVNNDFSPWKNVDTLLRAWPIVQESQPQTVLWLAGGGYQEGGAAHSWAKSRGLLKGVNFVGTIPRSDLPAAFQSSTLFVHPSREEAFSMVVLEAMASGTPTVAGRDAGAVPWLLQKGGGALVDVDDPEALAEGIVQALRHPEELAAYRRIAYERARREFTSDAAAKRIVESLAAIDED